MTTPILYLDEWEESQSQPYVTMNEAIRWLECFSQLSVLDRDLTEPPETPQDGDLYIPASVATGDWEGHENQIALYLGNAWAFRDPPPGAICYVQDEDLYIRSEPGSSPSGWVDLNIATVS